MQIIIDDLAKQSIIDIYYYNYQYSLKKAIEVNKNIFSHIHFLENSPYLGRYIPEMPNKQFREIIYKASRYSSYRIMYYISENSKTIYIFNIISTKQNFNQILKLHNYFNNYFNL